MLLLKRRTPRSANDRLQRRIDRLVAAGDHHRAIDILNEAVRAEPAFALEKQLVELRHRAFESTSPATAGDWPPHHDGRFDEIAGVPAVEAAALDAEALRAGVIGKGALIVRRLLDDEMVSSLVESVHESFERYDRSDHCLAPPKNDPWLSPWNFGPNKRDGRPTRDWTRRASGVLAADSPRSMFRLVDVLHRTGTVDLARQYFGAPPALSVLKTTLRKVVPNGEVSYGWHQDGAFLGSDIRALNVWIALSDCGVTAPSLQMVPRRIDHVINSGGDSAVFSWTVGGDEVLAASGPQGPQWLEFEAGDVIFFDHLNLHSTAMTPEMVDERLAVEAWLFATSHFPIDRIPLAI